MSEVVVLCVRVVEEPIRKTTSKRRRGPRPDRAVPANRVAKLLVALAAAVIVANALVGDQGVFAMIRARREYDALAASIARQRSENARLREEVRRLREDPSAIEEVARRELGLIRPGEKVFIVKDLPRQ